MSINYQRRDFLRRTFYCGLALGMPQPALAAMGTTAEVAQQQVAARYFRWKIQPFMKPPTVQYFQGQDTIPVDRDDVIDHVRIPQVSDDGVHWRDAERVDLDGLDAELAYTAVEHHA